VNLPLAATQVVPAGATAGHPLADTALDGQRLLVVDDNRDAADSLAAVLAIFGADVHTAYDGPSALAAVRAVHPSVVLLDLGMPGMSGYAVAQQLRSEPRYRALKLIALTGWGQQDDVRRTQESGFDDHLVKPVETQRLIELLVTSMR